MENFNLGGSGSAIPWKKEKLGESKLYQGN